MKAALASRARHIAMIASQKKIAGLKASLGKAGIESAQLERIHSPAGIEIGGVTPAEIALSVLAELVRVRRAAPAPESGEINDTIKASPEAAEVTVSETGGGCCDG